MRVCPTCEARGKVNAATTAMPMPMLMTRECGLETVLVLVLMRLRGLLLSDFQLMKVILIDEEKSSLGRNWLRRIGLCALHSILHTLT